MLLNYLSHYEYNYTYLANVFTCNKMKTFTFDFWFSLYTVKVHEGKFPVRLIKCCSEVLFLISVHRIEMIMFVRANFKPQTLKVTVDYEYLIMSSQIQHSTCVPVKCWSWNPAPIRIMKQSWISVKTWTLSYCLAIENVNKNEMLLKCASVWRWWLQIWRVILWYIIILSMIEIWT